MEKYDPYRCNEEELESAMEYFWGPNSCDKKDNFVQTREEKEWAGVKKSDFVSEKNEKSENVAFEIYNLVEDGEYKKAMDLYMEKRNGNISKTPEMYMSVGDACYNYYCENDDKGNAKKFSKYYYSKAINCFETDREKYDFIVESLGDRSLTTKKSKKFFKDAKKLYAEKLGLEEKMTFVIEKKKRVRGYPFSGRSGVTCGKIIQKYSDNNGKTIEFVV